MVYDFFCAKLNQAFYSSGVIELELELVQWIEVSSASSSTMVT